MPTYHEVVYGKYPKSNYPEELASHIYYNYLVRGIYNIRGGEVDLRVSHTSILKDTKILDLGCGDGTYVKLFKEEYGLTAYGIDNQIDFNKDKLPYPTNRFDFVFTKSTIEHIQNTNHLLKEIKRVLKPKGRIIILSPAWEYNWKDFYNDYTHVKPFHRRGLQDALRINGFRNVDVSYFYHLPWLWNHPRRFPLVLFLRMFSRWKWKNREENIHRPNIRFAQEVQLLAVAEK